MTYTQHKLTDAQLRRLSALVNETRSAATAGMAGKALLAKGLAEGKYWPERVTDLGRAALQQARSEGW
jgi:hypothetical protein